MKRFVILTLLMAFSIAQMRAQNNGYEARAEIYGFAGRTGAMTNLGGVNVINGYNITDCFFVGMGTGFEFSNVLYEHSEVGNKFKYKRQSVIPLYVNFRYKANTRQAKPFLSLDAGWSFNVNKDSHTRAIYGLLISPRFGVEIQLRNGTGLYGSLGPRFQHSHYWHKIPGKTGYVYNDKDKIHTIVCAHLGFRF